MFQDVAGLKHQGCLVDDGRVMTEQVETVSVSFVSTGMLSIIDALQHV